MLVIMSVATDTRAVGAPAALAIAAAVGLVRALTRDSSLLLMEIPQGCWPAPRS